MTLIVGIQCSDGVVIGADSGVTYVDGGGNFTVMQESQKLHISEEFAILACSGDVTIAQQYADELDQILRLPETGDNKYRKSDGTSYDAPNRKKLLDEIRARFRERAKLIWEMAGQVAPLTGRRNDVPICESLLAIPLDGVPTLVQLDANLGPLDVSRLGSPHVSIGSGQQSADPFLAFVRRVYYQDSIPTVAQGERLALWTLTNAINSSVGFLKEPVWISVLGNDERARLIAEEELEEHREFIRRLEEQMSSFESGDPDAPEVPEPTRTSS